MSSLRLCYETFEFADIDIHVRRLRNRQEYQDDDGEAEALGISTSNWSLFGVVWESSILLARLAYSFELKERRILEVGCGLGLPSLMLSLRGADISATDYHPEVESFMKANVLLNDCKNIPFFLADWNADQKIAYPDFGTFDLIIASDLMYERGHAELLASFIDSHAKPVCEVIIADPGRGQLGRFGRLMAERGYTSAAIAPTSAVLLPGPDFSGGAERFVRG